MSKGLCNKTIPENFSSMEQLDIPIEIISPKEWICLIGLGVLVIVGIFWSVLGMIPKKAKGQGILMQTEGVFDIVACSRGKIEKIYVKVNDHVSQGDIVAIIAQPRLVDQIQTLEANLKERESKYSMFKELDKEYMEKERKFIIQQERTLKQSIISLTKKLTWLRQKIKTQEQLLKEGLITKQTLVDTQENIGLTTHEIDNAQNELENISLELLQSKNQKQQELLNLKNGIEEIQRKIKSAQNELTQTGKVISPYTGQVLEISAEPGNIVQENFPVISIQRGENKINNLQAILFFPLHEGKKIKPQMKIQLSPATVKKEEYGAMQGIVTYVSDFPATRQRIMHLIKNEALAELFSKQGPPIEVHASLISDPQTASGYKWSSSKGPDLNIESGTACSADAIVEEQHPISLVIPLLKKKLLGIGE